MDRQPLFPQPLELAASVEKLPSGISGLNCLRARYRDGLIDCYSLLQPLETKGEGIHKAIVTLIEVKLGNKDAMLAVEIDYKSELDVFDLIPDEFGQSQGIIARCRDVVDCISTPALRRFVSDVFSLAKVHQEFWTSPVRYTGTVHLAGGLADASIRMAEGVAIANGLAEIERDFGIAYGLLHDIRLLWVRDRSKLTAGSSCTNAGNIVRVQNPINTLAAQDAEMALTMRQLLSRSWENGLANMTPHTRALARRASLMKRNHGKRVKCNWTPFAKGDDNWGIDL